MTTIIPADWKPIESAPKDGTEFQAWLHVGLWEPRCRFNPDSEALEIWGRVDYDRDDWDACSHLTVTHWMPKPAAPGVSTVEDASDIRSRVMEVIAGVWDRATQIDDAADEVIDMLRSAPADGDAQVLAALKQAHMALIGFMPQHRNAVIVNAIVAAREAIDAALAAQRKGDA